MRGAATQQHKGPALHALAVLPLLALAAPARAESSAPAPAPSPATVGATIDVSVVDQIRRLAQVESETASADGFIRVRGDCLPFPDKAALLGFLEDLRTALGEAFGRRNAPPADAPEADFAGPVFHILLRAVVDPDATNAPASVSHRIDLSGPANGGAALVVTITNPANGLEPHRLAACVTDGLLRLKVLERRANGLRPRPPPPWFAEGLARLLDPGLRQSDFDAVRDTWFRGRLPPSFDLLAKPSGPRSVDPAAAAQLVSFWLSFPHPERRLRTLSTRLAHGVPWSPELFFSTSLGDASALTGDRAFDAWLYGRVTHVLSLGVTTTSLVARTRIQMQVFPGRDGVPADWADVPQPLERLLEPDSAPWAASAARALRARILRQAAGRGDAYREAARQYADFFSDVIAGGRRLRGAADRLSDARAALDASATPP